MGLPNINVVFRTQAATAIQRSQKGVVALIVLDPAVSGAFEVTSVTDIPEEFTVQNADYVKRALIGYINPPKKVLVYACDGTEKTLEDALAYLETQKFDYLAAPLELSSEDAQTVAAWVKSQRQNHHMVKAVLPNIAADSEGIVNFTAAGMKEGEKELTTAAFCSRIAGLIAGTPMTISATYAPLPELTDVTRLTDSALDEKIDSGELVLKHDGERVKVGRAVNSLVTTTQEKGEAFKKIKIVEAVDMIKTDIRQTIEDSWIGKYANSYDNKCLLIMAVKGYLEALELEGILQRGYSTVEIDMAAQENYLKTRGVNTGEMTVQQIKEADTGSHVFLLGSIRILDAIEDVQIDITI